MSKGMLIVIEGSDGCGKETQSKLLKERLEHFGINTLRLSFPTYGTEEAKLIESYLKLPKDTKPNEIPSAMELATYYAIDRAAIFRKYGIREKLDEGITVICDRYVESNLIYQSALAETDEEYEEIINHIKLLEYSMLKLPIPDKIFYLKLDREVSDKLLSNRDSLDRNESNKFFMTNIDNNGLSLAKQQDWTIIDCNDSMTEAGIRTPEDINNQIMRELLTN